VDNAAIVALVAGEDEDGDDVEGAMGAWTTTRLHVQLGIVGMISLDLGARVTES
jgi:hypothetical protein